MPNSNKIIYFRGEYWDKKDENGETQLMKDLKEAKSKGEKVLEQFLENLKHKGFYRKKYETRDF